MKVMVVGSGGREHAIAWKASRSPLVRKVFVCPGNAGTAMEAKCENISLEATDTQGLLEFSKNQDIDLVIIGPEAPLVAGLSDLLSNAGIPCFGPSRSAARLEGSKVFTKDFLTRHRISTARYQSFTDCGPAKDYVRKLGAPIVVKADGLAGGKGVIVAKSEDEACAAVDSMLLKGAFGEAGKRIVLEECLAGEEVSFIVITDGKHILPMATSQDHKARDNGDRGPNTGGMGAYSPAGVVTGDLHGRIMREIIEPTVTGMAEEGNLYKGFLYAGLMITPDGTARVLEFNCRLGDPEAQPLLMRLESDLVEMCLAAVSGTLSHIKASWDPRPALGVVMAAGGYPEVYNKGDLISGLPERDLEDAKVFHAGTKLDGDNVVTSGGRVLCVTAMGRSVKEAQDRAYRVARQIRWKDAYYRTDIGHRAIMREALGNKTY
jgi:phosphoribosylamine--glycine ligase